MAKYQTEYQKIAVNITKLHPMRKFKWYTNRLFWKTRQGWLELVVNTNIESMGSWFQVSKETSEIPNKENQE